jgi:hypothetical protein
MAKLRTLANFSNNTEISNWARKNLEFVQNQMADNTLNQTNLEKIQQNLLIKIPEDTQTKAKSKADQYEANLAAIQTLSLANTSLNNQNRLNRYLTQPNPSNSNRLASNLANINEKYLKKLSKGSYKYNATQANLALNFYAGEGVSNNEKRRILHETASRIRAKRDAAARAANAARAAKSKGKTPRTS